MTTEPLPRLASHGLAAPTTDDVKRFLQVTEAEHFSAVWERVCRTAQVSPGAYLLDVDEAERLVQAVRALPGLGRLAGHDLAVRAATYRALADVSTATAGTASDWSRRSLEKLLRNRVIERARLQELADLDVFGERGHRVLTGAADKVARTLRTPVGATSVVLSGAQVFHGWHGLDGWLAEVGGTPVEWSFCATTLRSREPYVVNDTSSDVVQRTNPLVRNDGVGSYAGAPVTTARGHVVGAVCVIDTEPRDFGDAEVDVLRTAAAEVADRLEEQRRRSADEDVA